MGFWWDYGSCLTFLAGASSVLASSPTTHFLTVYYLFICYAEHASQATHLLITTYMKGNKCSHTHCHYYRLSGITQYRDILSCFSELLYNINYTLYLKSAAHNLIIIKVLERENLSFHLYSSRFFFFWISFMFIAEEKQPLQQQHGAFHTCHLLQIETV